MGTARCPSGRRGTGRRSCPSSSPSQTRWSLPLTFWVHPAVVVGDVPAGNRPVEGRRALTRSWVVSTPLVFTTQAPKLARRRGRGATVRGPGPRASRRRPRPVPASKPTGRPPRPATARACVAGTEPCDHLTLPPAGLEGQAIIWSSGARTDALGSRRGELPPAKLAAAKAARARSDRPSVRAVENLWTTFGPGLVSSSQISTSDPASGRRRCLRRFPTAGACRRPQARPRARARPSPPAPTSRRDRDSDMWTTKGLRSSPATTPRQASWSSNGVAVGRSVEGAEGYGVAPTHLEIPALWPVSGAAANKPHPLLTRDHRRAGGGAGSRRPAFGWKQSGPSTAADLDQGLPRRPSGPVLRSIWK